VRYRGLSDKALEIARSLDYPDLKTSILVELADRLLPMDVTPRLWDYWRKRPKRGRDRVSGAAISALVAIASLNKRFGQEDQAFEVLTGAHRLCNESEDLAKDPALAQIAVGFAELKRYDQADRVIEEIDDPFQLPTRRRGWPLNIKRRVTPGGAGAVGGRVGDRQRRGGLW